MFRQFESTQKRTAGAGACALDHLSEVVSVKRNPLRSQEQHVLCVWSWALFFLSWWLEYLVGYFRSARFLGSDVCTILTICLVIRQSREGCPCQEGGQGTNSFLFLDTSIYQAWLHASHTLKVGVHVCVYVWFFFFLYMCVGWKMGKDPCAWVRNFTGKPTGCGISKWCKSTYF